MYWTGKDSGSGVIGYKISDKQSDWGKDGYTLYNGRYSSYADSYTFTNNGTYYLYLKDYAGYEVCQGINIRNIDTTAPYIENFKKSTNSYTQKVKVSWTVTDTGVGVKAWKISRDKDSWNGSYTNTYASCYSRKSDSVTIKENGTYYLFVQDDKGNTKRKGFTINNIDRDAPAFNAKPTVKNSGSYAVISYRAYDKKSGIKSWKLEGYTGTNYYYDKNGKETILYDTNMQNITVVKNGTYKLILKDDAGNAITSGEIKVSGIDATPPTIEASVKSDKKKAILTWSAKDNVGITGYKIVKEANAGNSSGYTKINSTKSLSNINYTFNENGTWYLYVKDAKGNYSFKKITVSDIDKTAPTIENIKFSPTNKEVKSVKMSWTGKDSGSGVIGYKISDKQNDYGKGGYTVYNKKYSNYSDSYTFTKNGKYYLYLKDDAGNETCKGINIKNIDTTEPGIENFKISTNKYTQKVTVSWTATDTGVGVKAWKISKDKKSLNGKYTNIYEKRYSRKSDSATIKENGTYYLFIQDDNGNTKRKEFTINNIDRDDPKFTAKPTVRNYGSYAVISYRAQDKKSGIKSWKLEGYSGTNYYYNKDGKEIIAADTNTQKITVVKEGTYKLTLKDAAGNATTSEEIKVSGIDNVNPKITNLKVVSNTGKTINGMNYIKKNSKLTFRVEFSEAVEIDKSKITVEGMNTNSNTISVNKINDKLYDIVLTGNTLSLKSQNGEVKIILQKEFAEDLAGNKLKADRTIGKIILDNNAPKVEANYKEISDKEDNVSAKITDGSKIAKMQWIIIDTDTNKEVWTSVVRGEKEPLNKSTISEKDNILKLKAFKGKVVKLYVEDILGNKNTVTINPPVRASYKFVSRNVNEVTFRITMNLKAKLDSNLASLNNLKQVQDGVAKNYTFKSLKVDTSDNTGRKFLLTVVTDGTEKPATIKIPKGAIYVYNKNDSREQEIKIQVDNKPPTISDVNIPTTRMQKVNLYAHVADTDSGIAKYNYKFYKNDELLGNKTEKASGTNADIKISLSYNRTVLLTVWDNQGNFSTKEMIVNIIDKKAPIVQKITYGNQDENGKLDVTIKANEKITAKNWENIDDRTIKRTFTEPYLRGENVKADAFNIKDEAGNATLVKLEDKIAPRVTSILVTDLTNNNKKVDIKFSEPIKQTNDLKTAGWILSEDMITLSKETNSNEEIYVQDLLGNETEEPIKIKIKDEETEKLVTKISPKEKNNPVTEHFKTLFLSRKVKFVNLLNLANIAEYSILDEGMRIRIKFVKNFSNPEPIQLIEEDGSITYVTISPVYNVVIKGDSNNDGTVTKEDLELLIQSYNTQIDDRYKFYAMDMNDDEVINIQDYALWKSKYN